LLLVMEPPARNGLTDKGLLAGGEIEFHTLSIGGAPGGVKRGLGVVGLILHAGREMVQSRCYPVDWVYHMGRGLLPLAWRIAGRCLAQQ
jgi:hypothetical protein